MRTTTPRRFLLTLALFAAMIAAPFGRARGQWVQANGYGFHGQFESEASLGDILLVATDYDLFRSLDTGKSWSDVGLEQEYNRSDYDDRLAVIGNTIYIPGMYSTDTGRTWATQSATYYPDSRNMCSLGSLFFAGGDYIGVYVSKDSGNTWNTILHPEGDSLVWDYQYSKWDTIILYDPINSYEILAIASLGTRLIASVSSYDTNSQLFVSFDSGLVWTSVKSPIQDCGALCVHGGTIIAGTNGGLFRSTDTGLSWRRVGVGIVDSFNTSITQLNNYIFASNHSSESDEVACSTDDGITWFQVPNAASYQGNYGLFTFGGSLFTLTGNNRSEIYQSIDAGASWFPSSQDLSAEGDLSCFASIGNMLFASSGWGIFQTSDLGLSWTYDTNNYSNDLSQLYYYCGKMFALSESTGVWLSPDSGKTWHASNTGLTYSTYPRTYAIISIGSNLFLGTDGNGLFRSTDTGNSWEPVLNGTSVLDSFPITLCAYGSSLFVGTEKNGLFRSTNGGESWSNLNTDFNQGIITAFYSVGNYIFASTYHYDTVSGYITWSYRSSDGGNTWVKENLNFASLTSFGNDIFAIAQDSLYLSTDFGDNWSNISAGLPTSQAFHPIAVFDGNLFVDDADVIVADDVWRRPLSDFGISSVAQTPAASQPAIQSFPNPFTQSTEITFTTPAAGYAEISIVNSLGAEVARLYAGELEAGNHSLAWEPEGCADGNYWCVVRMNGTVETLPIVMLP